MLLDLGHAPAPVNNSSALASQNRLLTDHAIKPALGSAIPGIISKS